jgi:RNA polymerase sigma-32 factor
MYWRHRPKRSGLPGIDLAHDDEIELVQRYQRHGDLAARDALVLNHLRLVQRFAHYFVHHGSTFEDLCQEGCLALLRAIVTFAPERGVRFATYAAYWIRARMQREVAQARAHWYTAPANQAYVTSTHKIDDAKLRLHLTLSLDAMVSDDFDASFESVVPGTEKSVEVQVAEQELRTRLWQSLAATVNRRHDHRSLAICTQRLLCEEPATLEKLSAQLKLSREGVRQLELRLVNEMRQMLTACEVA